MYLVTGGTGTLGRLVVARLRAQDAPVRVLTRRPGAGANGAEVVVGDLATGDGLDAAVAGLTAVIHCASQSRVRGADRRGTANLIDAAAKAGVVPTLVYISIVGADRVPLPYYGDKVATERLIHQQSTLPWTILRTTQFHELIEFLCDRASRRWIMPVLSGTSYQPIAADEVAARLVALAGEPARGRVDDMGGPQVRRFADLARAYLRAEHRRRLLVPTRVPGAVGRGYRAGWHLTPEHAVGVTTFEQYLAARRSSHASP